MILACKWEVREGERGEGRGGEWRRTRESKRGESYRVKSGGCGKHCEDRNLRRDGVPQVHYRAHCGDVVRWLLGIDRYLLYNERG